MKIARTFSSLVILMRVKNRHKLSAESGNKKGMLSQNGRRSRKKMRKLSVSVVLCMEEEEGD